MFASIFCLIALYVGVLNASLFGADYRSCYPGEYCGTGAQLATQPGVYDDPQDCANQCSFVSKNNKYFSYVPSSGQCLCATSCNNQVANPNVNSYCLYGPRYDPCVYADGYYCGPNSAVVTQPGVYDNELDCAWQCFIDNRGYKFMNYVPSSGQCECLSTCTELIQNPNANTFTWVLGGQLCFPQPSSSAAAASTTSLRHA